MWSSKQIGPVTVAMSTEQWYMPTCGVAHTNTTTMNHLPDLPPCDFVQFPKVKIKLKDNSFRCSLKLHLKMLWTLLK